MKSEGRNPKSERRPKSEIRRQPLAAPGVSDFGFRPSFGFRISDFGFPSRLCVFALILLSSVLSHAETPTAVFDVANRLYEQGKYVGAAAAYEKLLQSGQVSSALYYNLGNAQFKAGQIGHAIAAYRQAQQMSPRDPDLRANLQFARNQIQGPTLAPSRFQIWLGRLTLNEWTMLTAVLVWLWLLLLALLQWRPSLKPALRNYTFTLGLAVAVLCACTASAFYQTPSNSIAIVIVRDTNARQSPFDESPTAITLHDGAELQVLDQKDDWLQVSADARRAGWLHRNQVALVPGT
jgi:tetratricopeptide (TPR) repeat protein